MKMTNLSGTVFAAILLLLKREGSAIEDIKTWNVDTNFDNPDNWMDRRIPCENDRVVFPPNTSVLSFVSISISIAEMVLPMNGEIVLKEGVSLDFTGGNVKGNCVGKEARFIVRPRSWYDAENWNFTSPRALPSDLIRRNMAVPHTTRIPCSKDRVVFPDDSSFKVFLDSQIVPVAFVKINGVDYENGELRSLLQTNTGKLLFPDHPEMVVSSRGCSDAAGCDCGYDTLAYEQFAPKVCSNVVECPAAKCDAAIKPFGHCCPICGAYLQMGDELGFQMSSYMNFLSAFLSEEDFLEIDSYTGRINGGMIQTVFTESGKPRGAYYTVSKLIYHKLKHDIEAGNTYRLKFVKLYQSGQLKSDAQSGYYTREGFSTGGTVAIVFIILAIAGAITAWYIYRKRRIPGFSFARFDLRGGKIEMELGTTPHEDLNPEESPSACAGISDKGFDKILKGQSTNELKSVRTEQENEGSEDVIENPMFSIFEKTSEDPVQEPLNLPS